MKTNKYIVVWHESNHTGEPKHVMGSSPLFVTEKEAKDWIDNTVEEDRGRAVERNEHIVTEYVDGEGILVTEGNNQTCLYHVCKVETDDPAAECMDEVKKILMPKVDNLGSPIDAMTRVVSAVMYIEEHEKNWMPMREWAVDIRFAPASCVHHVMARTADEAELLVNDMIDSRRSGIITDQQKAEMMDTLLENVESVEAVGPEDE